MFDAEFENLELVQEDRLAILTLNRPKNLNALNMDTLGEIAGAISLIEENSEIDALIITGAGEKAFVAGADIAELAEIGSAFEGREAALLGQDVFQQISTLPFLTVAAINGFALGGGLELALACDVRIASQNAKMGLPETTLGLIPGYGGTQRLPRIVGIGRALDMMISGRMVNAEEAKQMGLVSQVAEHALDAAKSYVAGVLKRSGTLAVGLIKEAVRRGMDTTFSDGLEIEADMFGYACSTKDMKEGTKAFLEKRPAQFKGE